MKVAITIWDNRISPVLDSSHMLLIAEIENSKIMNKTNIAYNPQMPSRLPELLSELGIEVLICGAVSQLPADMIESSGVKLIPFITGNVDEILASYAKSATVVPSYLMPGCGCKSRKKQRRQKSGIDRQFKLGKMPAGPGSRKKDS